ncbi:U5 snRNP complex subunit [Maudiozyma humilis]|uniref:U5 snRNP complex subunit n=1 Tax=Maudiozyma humilis TaxID=51915 RepID=A0AAV5RVJ4_MAUHU|nr:U5 snRNP complex subunit [Kazachstania humilis]
MSNILFSDLDHATTLGIDTLSINVPADRPLGGIRDIPHANDTDVHVIHFQHGGAQSGSSGRYGYWFARGNYYVVYDASLESYVLREERDPQRYAAALRAAEARGGVGAYPRVDAGEVLWCELSSELTWPVVQSLTRQSPERTQEGRCVYVETGLVTAEESALLQRVLHSEESNVNPDGGFEYTPIRFMSREAIRPGHEMEDYGDKSHYLNAIVLGQHMRGEWTRYIAELQYAFLNMLLLGNYGSSLQWHALVDLVCRSAAVPAERVTALDALVSAQLHVLPQEYRDTLLNEGMWVHAVQRSLQREHLPLTREALRTCGISPAEGGENEDDNEDNDDAYPDTQSAQYLNIEGPSDSEDEDGPVVVSRVTYR